ncbi:MAG: hypothetical protein NTV34_19470 [Proteobacteria bacterium]|nr:hypothetical protein [Pseudomonadota bacterium]
MTFYLYSVFGAFLVATSVVSTRVSAQVLESTYLDKERIVSSPIAIGPGEQKAIDLPMTRYLEKLELSAFGVGREAMFEVMVNGVVKGTIHVPGQDPDYVVTIAESSMQVVFRHLSGTTVQIKSVDAYYSQNSDGTNLPDNQREVAARISRDIIEKTAAFQPHIPAAEFKKQILPIKIAAGHAYAVATASGDLSLRLRDGLQLLIMQFDQGKQYIDALMADDSLFDLCVQTLELNYELKDLMD